MYRVANLCYETTLLQMCSVGSASTARSMQQTVQIPVPVHRSSSCDLLHHPAVGHDTLINMRFE